MNKVRIVGTNRRGEAVMFWAAKTLQPRAVVRRTQAVPRSDKMFS